MTDPDALGTLIRSTRLDRGLSLGQLASAVDRSLSTVRRWERGESAPPESVLGDLANALDLDAEDLGAIVESDQDDEIEVEHAPISDVDVDEIDESRAAEPAVRTTIEDDEVVAEIAQYFETDAPAAPPSGQSPPSTYGRLSSAVWGRRDSWIGWVRGFLTALALLFLFMGLTWALGELFTALKDVLASFSTGA
ncbi:MAG: helix-turn-helix transcriptional regulator [Actinomycetota bacterium]